MARFSSFLSGAEARRVWLIDALVQRSSIAHGLGALFIFVDASDFRRIMVVLDARSTSLMLIGNRYLTMTR